MIRLASVIIFLVVYAALAIGFATGLTDLLSINTVIIVAAIFIIAAIHAAAIYIVDAIESASK